MTFSIKCHQIKTTAEAGTATGCMKGHFEKGLDELVAFNLCLHLPLFCSPREARRSFGGPSPHWSSHHDTSGGVKLLKQAHFSFWQPRVFLFSPKEHIIIITQITMFFGSEARKESAKEW